MGDNKDSEDLVHVEEKVTDVARKVIDSQIADDAFFVCDLRDLEAKIKLWRQEMPRVTPFYAVKACSDPVILHILNFYGVNFDCSNKAEMMSVFDIGVSPERIVYANTVKCTSHLRFAQQRGVTLITFDSVEELDKIEDPNARSVGGDWNGHLVHASQLSSRAWLVFCLLLFVLCCASTAAFISSLPWRVQ
ncbi:hypothetical protein V5799_003086 [Amblyomma americanum]|uniref:Orn/DAP/Arg decarboxylase 2 N-terminal domain-containing protein n=1 Tax=Amblyomma americanum TaxID=6943 RepID=A0AAQ4D9Z3_AMBAM